jgi:hypothetical protein
MELVLKSRRSKVVFRNSNLQRRSAVLRLSKRGGAMSVVAIFALVAGVAAVAFIVGGLGGGPPPA